MKLARDFAEIGDPKAKELIALAVLAGSGLEKTLDEDRPIAIRERSQTAARRA